MLDLRNTNARNVQFVDFASGDRIDSIFLNVLAAFAEFAFFDYVDRLRFHATGAYTSSYASVGFNGFAPLKTYCI